MSETSIILRKTIYKEKDLILSLLDTNGNKYSVYCYGALSSKKKSFIEVGHAVELDFSAKTSRHLGMLTLKEATLKWSYSNIRKNYRAYYHLIFMLELIEKIAMERTEDSIMVNDLYRVLTNGLYYLENSFHSTNKHQAQNLSFFLIKLIHLLGLMPSLNSCSLCANHGDDFIFQSTREGFECLECYQNYSPAELEIGNSLQHLFRYCLETPYKSLDLQPSYAKVTNRLLLQFFCGQNNLNMSDFKTLKTIIA